MVVQPGLRPHATPCVGREILPRSFPFRLQHTAQRKRSICFPVPGAPCSRGTLRVLAAVGTSPAPTQDYSDLLQKLVEDASTTPAPAPAPKASPPLSVPTPAPEPPQLSGAILDPVPAPPPATSPAVEQAIKDTSVLPAVGAPVEGGPVPAGGEGPADAVRGAASGAAEAASGAVDAAKDALEQTAASSAKALSGVTSSISSTAADAAAAVNSATSGVVSSVQEATSGITAGATQALEGLQSSFSSEIQVAQKQAASVQAGLESLQARAAGAVDAAVASLPEPVRQAFEAAGPPLNAFIAQATTNPAVGAAAAGALVGVPALLYWRARYGGYSGLLAPQSALARLQTEDVVLVDIRSEDVRLTRGIPELRFGARGKGAAVPIPAITPALARRVRNADELAFQIGAAVIAGLGKVGSNTSIVVMDAGDGRALRAARLVRAVGRQKVYVLEGGFQAWEAAGLPVKEAGTTDYDATPLDGLSDSAEVLKGQTLSLAENLKDPFVAVSAAGASALLISAVVNLAYTLEFIGAAGILLTIINKVSTYNSIDDAVADFNSTVDTVRKPIDTVSKILPKPSKKAAAPRPSLPRSLDESLRVSGGGEAPQRNGTAQGETSVQKAEA